MAGNTVSRTQSKISRLVYMGGIGLFLLPVFEPFLPLMLAIVGGLVLGGLVKFIFGLLINRNLNKTYRAYTSPNAGQTRGSGGSNTRTPGPNNPPARPPDPLKPYRAVLGLSPDFTQSQLRAAYRAMAAQYHPDRYTQAPVQDRQKAEEMMKKINEAYYKLRK
jgi:predicted lipid-binding transport protein (Tim44 family)